MASTEILCLAYSMKHGGRCVAGLDLNTGGWVRPVSAAEDGTLSEAACTLDIGRPIRPLDVVRIPLREPRPAPHQPENWVIGAGDWRHVEDWSIDDASEYLGEALEPGATLLGDQSKSLGWDVIQEHGVDASLCLVRVTAPRFEVNDWNRFRARFRRGGTYYDLSCTDLAPWATRAYRQGGIAPDGDWYLTVSLGEPWEETNHCYKIVAAGLQIPE